jgi:hypothetical protein
MIERRGVRATSAPSTSPQSGIKSLFSVPWFVLVLAGIRRPVVRIKAIEEYNLLPL